MAKFIKTHAKGGMPFTLNLDQVVTIHANGNGCKVILSTGIEIELPNLHYEAINKLVEATFD